MGLSVHDPFVDPLGNPLGLVREGGASAERAQKLPIIIWLTEPGHGEILIPYAKANYKIYVVGAGAAGNTTNSGGSGAVTIKSGIVSKAGSKLKWSVGKGGSVEKLDGDQSAVYFEGAYLVAGGGFNSSSSSASASGGDVSYPGLPGISGNFGATVNSSVGPAPGAAYSQGTNNGGGAGYGGGKGGDGGSASSLGGYSTAPFTPESPFLAGLWPTIIATTETSLSGQKYDSIRSTSGAGGVGGGGGGKSTNVASGGVGLVRIELW